MFLQIICLFLRKKSIFYPQQELLYKIKKLPQTFLLAAAS